MHVVDSARGRAAQHYDFPLGYIRSYAKQHRKSDRHQLDRWTSWRARLCGARSGSPQLRSAVDAHIQNNVSTIDRITCHLGHSWLRWHMILSKFLQSLERTSSISTPPSVRNGFTGFIDRGYSEVIIPWSIGMRMCYTFYHLFCVQLPNNIAKL